MSSFLHNLQNSETLTLDKYFVLALGHTIFWTKFSRMDEVKFVEDILNLMYYDLFKTEDTTSNFMKAVFQKKKKISAEAVLNVL